jgi:hypothetical protein
MREVQIPNPNPDPGKSALVTFHVSVPGLTRNATRAVDTELESGIDNITIFLAADGGSGYVMNSKQTVTDFWDVNANTIGFTLNVTATPLSTKIYLIANFTSDPQGSFAAMTDDNWGRGMAEAAWKQSLYDDALTSTLDNGIMYMCGEAVIGPIEEEAEINLPIRLIRWVARADLQLNLGVDSKSFVPTSATLFRGNTTSQLWAAASAFDSENTNRVAAPTIWSGGEIQGDPKTITLDMVELDTGRFATTYIGEASEETTEAGELAATCIVVGGLYDGSTEESFYRIDFNSRQDGHPFGQILRNWQYIFNITKVISEGYDTAENAATHPSNAMTVEVEMWSGNVQEVNFLSTGDYMYVSDNSIMVASDAGDSNTFMVRSTVDFDWQLNTETAADQDSDAEQLSGDYSARISARVSESNYTDYTFTITALSGNDGSSDKTASLFITAQGAVLSVKINQETASAQASRTINVLSSGTSWGSLGASLPDYSTLGGGTTETGGATQMRYILMNPDNFGPTASTGVQTSNIHLAYFPSSYFTGTINATPLAYDLNNIDVLNMGYDVAPSADVSETICDWLWADPQRVLIVGLDVTATNANLITEINSRVESQYRVTKVSSTTIATAAGALLASSLLGMTPTVANSDSQPFLQGPFGTVGTNTTVTFAISDGTGQGISTSASPGLTPLILWSSSTGSRTIYMFMAADLQNRIVYIGDCNSWRDSMVGGSTPSPSGGPLNIIMSNLWAWIVGVVQAE